jgi:hypothetical protein
MRQANGHSQLGQALSDMCFHGTQRGGQAVGDLLVAKALVVRQFHRLALAGGKLGQGFGDADAELGARGLIFRQLARGGQGRCGVDGTLVFHFGSRGKAAEPIDRPASCQGDQISAGGAPMGIVTVAAAPDLPKYVGDCVFSFIAAVQDSLAQREQLGCKSLVELGKRGAIAKSYGLQQFGVAVVAPAQTALS